MEGLSSRRAATQYIFKYMYMYTFQLLKQCSVEVARRAAEYFVLHRIRGALRRLSVPVAAGMDHAHVDVLHILQAISTGDAQGPTDTGQAITSTCA